MEIKSYSKIYFLVGRLGAIYGFTSDLEIVQLFLNEKPGRKAVVVTGENFTLPEQSKESSSNYSVN